LDASPGAAEVKSFVIPHGQQSLLDTLAQLDPKRRYVVTIDEPKRSLVRNAQLHAVISDIADQLKWHGDYYDTEDWKRMLTAGWMRATQRKIKLVPAVDGSGIDVLYQRTSRLTEAECRELIQYIYAFGVDQGVKFKDPHEEQAA
jgi:hypothetical protein